MRPPHIAVLTAAVLAVSCDGAPQAGDRFFASDGVSIRYQSSGRGPAVVLVHGLGETLESWHATGAVRALTPEFQVAILDVRGHGRSGKPTAPDAYGHHLAADVARLIETIGAEQAHIVGYSMGALVALDVAVSYPDRVLSVVLGGGGLLAPEARADFERQAEALERGVSAGDDQRARALAALLRGFRFVSDEDVRRIRAPVAALIGAGDPFMSDVQRLSRVVPRAQVTVIPDANHGTARGHPEFTAALLKFLREQRDITSSKTR